MPTTRSPGNVRATIRTVTRRRPAWFAPQVLRTEVLAGLAVALALIPEAISFSIIAGVDPRIGLFASFTMAVSISLLGGRPAMISAATGAVALVIAPVMRDHGICYLVATVLLAGVIQVALGLVGIARLMRFVPRMVMVGFVNALAILIFLAQLPQLTHVPFTVYLLAVAGLAIIYLLPRLTKLVPSPLVAIVVLTAVTVTAGISVPTVADQGALPDSPPGLFLPDVPLTWETLRIIGPFALGMALVGLLESLMTAKLVDDITDTGSNKTRESWGQGAANIITGFFGGMGGCAMIGQTMINVRSGARTRLSTFLAGVFLLILVVVLGDVVGRIPMAALVAVMVFVCISTFDWHSISLPTLKRMPRSELAVMVVTVAVTVATHNLAFGVIAGVLVALMLFARRVAHLVSVSRSVSDDGSTSTYRVSGQLFFASSNELADDFDQHDPADRIVIDLTAAQLWDASTVAALDAIEHQYTRQGKRVEVIGLDPASAGRRAKLSGHLGAGH